MHSGGMNKTDTASAAQNDTFNLTPLFGSDELKLETTPKARAFGWRVSRPDEICVEEKDRQMSMKKLNYAGEKKFNTVQ